MRQTRAEQTNPVGLAGRIHLIYRSAAVQAGREWSMCFAMMACVVAASVLGSSQIQPKPAIPGVVNDRVTQIQTFEMSNVLESEALG